MVCFYVYNWSQVAYILSYELADAVRKFTLGSEVAKMDDPLYDQLQQRRARVIKRIFRSAWELMGGEG